MIIKTLTHTSLSQIYFSVAQPIVMNLIDPYKTFKTNFLGTLNILETLRVINYKCSCVIITSINFANKEWVYGIKKMID